MSSHQMRGHGFWCVVLAAIWYSTSAAWADQRYNHFSFQWCTASHTSADCVRAGVDDTWHTLFPDPAMRVSAQRFNRQNLPLHPGQWVLRNPPQPYAPRTITHRTSRRETIVFWPERMSWAHYNAKGERIRAGPAIGGKVGARTNAGCVSIMERASPARRSSIYGVKIPYFLRITQSGQGFHAGPMRGVHESAGCIRLFRADARYLSQVVARAAGMRRFGWLTAAEQQRTPRACVWYAGRARK